MCIRRTAYEVLDDKIIEKEVYFHENRKIHFFFLTKRLLLLYTFVSSFPSVKKFVTMELYKKFCT